jgi:drug/metabolite transporter (DMT)-like permease
VFVGVVGTAFAFLLFYTMIAGAGAAYASLVTYLVPPVALAYGAVFLDEGIGWPAVVGLVLILTGVALGTARRRRVVPVRAALVAAPSEPT